MLNVLITGASGFIGSFLVEEGLRRKHNIYAAVRKSSSRKYLQDPLIHFVEMDFSSREVLVKTLSGLKNEGIHFDFIIHNAGITKTQDKEEFSRVNYLNTRNFIEGLIEAGMVPGKFIFMSSLAAFGPGNPQTMDPVMLKDEPKPIETYGRSKLEAEKFLTSVPDFPWLIFRPTGVYGPREKDYFVFFKTIKGGLEPYIGTRKQILTFIYVKDLVRLIFDAGESAHTGKAYFVSDGKEYGAQQFAVITKTHLNRKTLSFVVPSGIVKILASSMEKIYGLWGAIPTLNTDKYKVLASVNWKCETAPLQSDFNFQAEYDLDKGVKDALEWYHKEGWI